VHVRKTRSTVTLGQFYCVSVTKISPLSCSRPGASQPTCSVTFCNSPEIDSASPNRGSLVFEMVDVLSHIVTKSERDNMLEHLTCCLA